MDIQKSPLRILLADDDDGDRLVFQEIFEEMETATVTHVVNNGKQLLDFLKKEKHSLPNILFLDLNMPIMDGLVCLKKIRNNEKYSDILIAIYSTSTAEQDIDDAFQFGANIFITKPAGYRALQKVLAKSLTAARLRQNSDFDRSNFVLKI